MKNRLPYSLLAVCAVFLFPLLLSPSTQRRAAAVGSAAQEGTAGRVEEGNNRGESGPWREAGADVSAESLAEWNAALGIGGAVSVPETETPSPKRGGADASVILRVRTKTGDKEMSMAEYLPLAIAGEMPASFETEALKAQAVTLRSYVLRQREQPKPVHPEVDVCTDSRCCAAFGDEETLRARWSGDYESYMGRLRAAAADTDGEYLRYEGSPALAVFHACSYRNTEDGTALGVYLPYLVSVTSPETPAEVSTLNSTVEVTPTEFRETLRGAFPEIVLEAGNPSAWVGPVRLNTAGRVEQVELGGTAVSGLELRSLFSLRSTDFSLGWNGDRFVFRVSGYGHGLGMSQQGANLMAQGGSGYREILSHYYPGTELAAG